MNEPINQEEKASVWKNSLFYRTVNRFTKWFYSLIINGFFGKIFTSYSCAERSFKNSCFIKRAQRLGVFCKLKRQVRTDISKKFEQSRIITSVMGIGKAVLHSNLRCHGAFYLALGTVGGLVQGFTSDGFLKTSGDMISLISLAFFAVLGIVFLLFNKTFSEVVSESRLLTLLLFEGLGIPKDVFRASEKNCGYLIPILFGSFFGGLVYFVPPSFYFAAIATLILISLVIYMPEIGVVALFSSQAVAGFFPNPTVFVFAVIALTTLSFALKLIRGKRVFKLMFLDFSVLLFLTVRLFSGLFGVGGVEAFLQACVSSALMLGYFLTANLVNSQKWLNRTMGAFAVFSVLAAVVGVYQYFSGGFESGWLDASAFSGIKVRVTSLFDNPNSYGAYLLLVIPFLFSGINESKSIKGKWIYGSVLILSSFCIVQTWSRGAWVALIAELLAYYLVTSRKTVPALVSGLGAGTLLVCLFAPNVSRRILSIGNLSESSVSYRISAWKGIIDMMRAYWIGGIGYGEAAFISVYSRYAYSGASNLRHSHNLFLQILVECGAVGVISFSIFLFSFFCCCFEYLKMKGPGRRSSVIAGMSAVFGTAVMGMTDYVWYNSRVFLAFWLAVGFTVACIRNGWAERERVEGSENNSRFSADIELDSDDL